MILETIGRAIYHYRHGDLSRGFIEMSQVLGIMVAAFIEVIMLPGESSQEF